MQAYSSTTSTRHRCLTKTSPRGAVDGGGIRDMGRYRGRCVSYISTVLDLLIVYGVVGLADSSTSLTLLTGRVQLAHDVLWSASEGERERSPSFKFALL